MSTTHIAPGRILAAGALVGVLDGAFATALCLGLSTTCTVERLFQHIASGLVGREPAFSGGSAAALLGVALHFTIATGWATVYSEIYGRWVRLRRLVQTRTGTALAAIGFGFLVYLMMNLVVVRLSGARPTPVASHMFVIILLGHPVVVGLPIVLTVRSRGPAAAAA